MKLAEEFEKNPRLALSAEITDSICTLLNEALKAQGSLGGFRSCHAALESLGLLPEDQTRILSHHAIAYYNPATNKPYARFAKPK